MIKNQEVNPVYIAHMMTHDLFKCLSQTQIAKQSLTRRERLLLKAELAEEMFGDSYRNNCAYCEFSYEPEHDDKEPLNCWKCPGLDIWGGLEKAQDYNEKAPSHKNTIFCENLKSSHYRLAFRSVSIYPDAFRRYCAFIADFALKLAQQTPQFISSKQEYIVREFAAKIRKISPDAESYFIRAFAKNPENFHCRVNFYDLFSWEDTEQGHYYWELIYELLKRDNQHRTIAVEVKV